MKRKTTYGHQKTASHTGQEPFDGLYKGLSIDPLDLEILNVTYPAYKELKELHERTLAKYDLKAEQQSITLVACILRHSKKFTDAQFARFIQFIYEEEIVKNLSSLRMAIEALQPRFSVEPMYIRLQPLESNVASKTIIQIFDFVSDRFAISGNLKEILPQHFVSNTGTEINIKTIKKYIGNRKEEYPLDSFLKDRLEAIFS